MIKQDTLENQVNTVYLGIGSSLGNKRLNIEKTKFLLNNSSVKLIKSSSYYETLSWPNPNHPSYYNVIIKVVTKYLPPDLFLEIKKIEKYLGRVNSKKNSPRTCDIDIIDFNSKIFCFKINNNIIEIPHPRIKERNFVLIPLFEINKKWLHPKNKKKIIHLINNLSIKSLRSIKQF